MKGTTMRFYSAAALLVIGLAGTAPAAAGETRYEYDALGRLVSVKQSGVEYYDARYSYDKADNRASRTVTDAGSAVAVVPKPGGGYRVMPLGR